jgi:hypothetical protein
MIAENNYRCRLPESRIVTPQGILQEGVMKSYRKELWFEVPTRRAFINITPKVEACLKESGIKEGLILVKTKTI